MYNTFALEGRVHPLPWLLCLQFFKLGDHRVKLSLHDLDVLLQLIGILCKPAMILQLEDLINFQVGPVDLDTHAIRNGHSLYHLSDCLP